jgi:uncharacterized protein YeaO (DUF488 family)
MEHLKNLYNAKANTKMTDEEWEKYTEAWENLKEGLDQYEETVALWNEKIAEDAELRNLISENITETITYKVEYELELNEQDIELLEYYQDIYEDDLTKSSERMSALIGQAQETQSNLAHITQGIAELDAAYNATDLRKKINSADYQE